MKASKIQNNFKSKNNRLAMLINAAMFVRNLSAEDVAPVLGLSRQSVYKYLRDPGRLSVKKLMQLCHFLDIPIDDIRNAIDL